jgi:hypothetical protein
MFFGPEPEKTRAHERRSGKIIAPAEIQVGQPSNLVVCLFRLE